jgi:hypothetical protein
VQQSESGRRTVRPSEKLGAARLIRGGGRPLNARLPGWFGLFVPAKTPRDIVDKLHRETRKALQAPKVQDKLATIGGGQMVIANALALTKRLANGSLSHGAFHKRVASAVHSYSSCDGPNLRISLCPHFGHSYVTSSNSEP